MYTAYSIITENGTCCRHSSSSCSSSSNNSNLASVVRRLWRRTPRCMCALHTVMYCLHAALLWWPDARGGGGDGGRRPGACKPLAPPTVCRNRNSSCSSCGDIEHRWLTSGGAINRGAMPVIGAARPSRLCPSRVPLIVRPTPLSTCGPRPSVLSRRRVRPVPAAGSKGGWVKRAG